MEGMEMDKEKILIIEDENEIAELEKDYLELADFEVIMENDGRYILWRSTDYYKVSEPISFKCRNGKITHVYISFDHGGTYRDETKRFYVKAGDENALQLNRENFPKGDLCIKFRTRSGLITRESRDYRIRI